MAGSVCFDLVFNDLVGGAVGLVDGWFVAGFYVDGPFCFVDEGVVVTAEQGAVVDAGRAVVFPMLAVMDITPGWWSVTAGEDAVLVAYGDREPDRVWPASCRVGNVEDGAVSVFHDPVQGAVA